MHAHSHDHDHSHVPQGQRALIISLVLNGSFLVLELVVGWATGSLALLSDAAHMVSDVTALTVALVATWLSTRAASAVRTYGFRRAEVIGAAVNAIFLLGACALLVHEAIERLTTSSTHAPPGQWVLVVGVAGLAINLGSFFVLWRASDGNLNLRGAMLHMGADALGSVGAIVAAVFLMMGVTAADAWISLFIAALVVVSTLGLLRQVGRVLMESSPASVAVDAVHEALLDVDHVQHVHDLHVWSLTGDDVMLTAHLRIDDDDHVFGALASAQQLLHDSFHIEHVTLQPEAPGIPCRSVHCRGQTGANDDEQRHDHDHDQDHDHGHNAGGAA